MSASNDTRTINPEIKQRAKHGIAETQEHLDYELSWFEVNIGRALVIAEELEASAKEVRELVEAVA